MADFPEGGINRYFDHTPVFWVRKTVTRGQLDALVGNVRKELPVDEPLPPELDLGDYMDGALFATFPTGISRNQLSEVLHAVRDAVPGVDVKFTGVAFGAGITPRITDVLDSPPAE